MRIRMFQIDAFAPRPFAGNPAAVCPLDAWLGDGVLQSVAAENNLPETAFLVAREDEFELRWFTPEAEVDLCGHATLAAGFLVLRYMEGSRESVRFHSASGPLDVRRDGNRLVMDFPADPPEAADPPPELAAGLGREPDEVRAGRDWMAIYGTPDVVEGLEPELRILEQVDRRGVIATAPTDPDGSDPADFVSRFFAPKVGVPEDPVTGSAHCALAPYWAEQLGRTELLGRQVSRRGGEVGCTVRGSRVELSGEAALYLEGWIRIPA